MNDSSRQSEYPHKRLRFSLRTLFVLAAIVAFACYCLLLPTLNAQRFVRAIKAESFADADAYFRNPNDQFLNKWNEKHWRFKAEVSLKPWSFVEVLRGERSIKLSVMFGDAGLMRGCQWNVAATRAGLLSPQPTVDQIVFGGMSL